MLFDITATKKYGNIEFLAKQLVEGFITGLHKSPFHGFSVEFAEHRLYNTGESTRHIDWKVFAKTDRLYTKQYDEETNLRCHILIDTSSSMYYPIIKTRGETSYGKIDFSVLGAAAIANMLQKQKDAVGLFTFADDIEIQTPIKSTPTHIHNLYNDLETLRVPNRAGKKTSTAEVIHQIAEKIHKRSLVIIFSDMFDDIANAEKLFSSLQHLKHNNHEVLLFHVTDKKTEENFEFEDRPYQFIDLENPNEKIELEPSQVRDYYQKTIKQFYTDLKIKCGQYKIEFIDTDINLGFDQIMTSYLTKRAKMR